MKVRKKIVILGSLLLLVVVAAAAYTMWGVNKDNVKAGKYSADEENRKYIDIYESGMACFQREGGLNPIAGEYTVEDGELVLTSDWGEYVFRVDGKKIIFISGGYTQGLVDPGMVFSYVGENDGLSFLEEPVD